MHSGNTPSGTLQGNASLDKRLFRKFPKSHGQQCPPTLLRTRGACRRPAPSSREALQTLSGTRGAGPVCQCCFLAGFQGCSSTCSLACPVLFFTGFLCPAGALPTRLPNTPFRHICPARLPDSPVCLLNKNLLASPSAKPVSLTGFAGTSGLTEHRRGIPCPEGVSQAGWDFELFVLLPFLLLRAEGRAPSVAGSPYERLDDWKQGSPGLTEEPGETLEPLGPVRGQRASGTAASRCKRRPREASFHKRVMDRAVRTVRSGRIVRTWPDWQDWCP